MLSFYLVVSVALNVSGRLAVVATDGCDQASTAAYARALRQSLQHRPSLEVQSEEDGIEKLGGAPRASLADAERLISAARVDVFEGNGARAERTLQTAVSDLERLPPSRDRWTGIVDSHAMLAWICHRQNRPAEAAAAFDRILRVDPGFAPNANLYPPSLRKVADTVRARVKADSKVTLSVITRPEGIEVFVGGKPLGRAPVAVTLPKGEYLVEGTFDGRRGLPKRVELQTDAAVELDRAFEGAVRPDQGPCLSTSGGREGRLAALVRMASLLDVSSIVAAREEEPAGGERYLVATAVDGASGEETREARVKIYAGGVSPGAIDRLADFLTTGEATPPIEALRGKVDAPPTAQAVEKTVIGPGTDVPKKELLDATKLEPAREQVDAVHHEREPSRIPTYATAGTGVVLLAGAGVFFLQATETDRQIEQLRGTGAFSEGSEAQVRELNAGLSRHRTTSIALAGTAAAAGITAVILFLTSSPSDPTYPGQPTAVSLRF
ncbi:MAG: PEGA domain-containing protein [Myxococcaceae bacterium]